MKEEWESLSKGESKLKLAGLINIIQNTDIQFRGKTSNQVHQKAQNNFQKILLKVA